MADTSLNQVICQDPGSFGYQPFGNALGAVLPLEESVGFGYGGFGEQLWGDQTRGYGIDAYGVFFYGSEYAPYCFDTEAPIVSVIDLVPSPAKVSQWS